MRLIDVLFRQGHLSERALVDALLIGERPAHLERCDICAERAVELGRWLDDVRTIGVDAADHVFSTDRLTAQHAQILRRLEQLDHPARVIAFPSQSRLDARGSDRRVAPAWVGVAAAAGLVLGVIGGQITARAGRPAPPATAVDIVQTEEFLPAPPGAAPWIDMELDRLSIPSLDAIDGITPRMTYTTASVRPGG